MKQLQTKEHLIYFMQSGMIRLGTYDLRFVKNLQQLANQQKEITSNQAILFDKLVIKYIKQLKKHNLSSEFLNSLKWSTIIINSDSAFTDAFISIDKNNKILLKAPFNKKFIQEFKKIPDNSFEWQRETKLYEADYSTIALKVIVKIVQAHYSVINYCPVITELLNTLDQYANVKYWQPTLVLASGNYIVACANEALHASINHIQLNNNMSTLSLLSEYGVAIDATVIQNEEKLKFASEYVTEVDISQIYNIIDYLTELQCDCVYFAGNSGVLFTNEVRTPLSIRIPNWHHFNDMSYDTPAHDYKYPVVLQFSSSVSTAKIYTHNIKKIIKMKNSTPIDIK